MTDTLREYVNQILEVSRNADLITVDVGLRVRVSKEKDYHVPDIMTNIRVAPGVATARQTDPIQRLGANREILNLAIKYMPQSAGLANILTDLGKAIKAVPGVEIVKILKVGGRPVHQEGGMPFVF